VSSAIPIGRATVGTTQIYNGRQSINAVILNTDGVNAGRCVLYDNNTGTASGKILADVQCTGAALNNWAAYNVAVFAEIGIVAVVTGTGATADIYGGGR
jgi:hypothetical protein